MGALVRKLFNLYPGEERSALLFALLGFLWSLGAYCGWTLSDGMFLEHVGASSLPLIYLFMAFGLFGCSFLFLWAFKHFNAFRIYLICLFLGFLGYALLILLLPATKELGHHPFWFSVKLFCNMLGIVLTTCFWFFVDQYFNLQNAKRLYSLFNASIFLGNACGGALIAFSLEEIGVKGIFFAIIALLFVTSFWVFYIHSFVPHSRDEGTEDTQAPEHQPLGKIIRGFLRSKFTLLLMFFYFLIQLINVTTEYTYMQSFDAYFDIPRTESVEAQNQLTIFLGQATAWIALANVFFGFFFYSRLAVRFGLSNMIGISSLFFLITFTSWSFTDALLVAILGLVVVEGISYTLDENNSNLLLNAVPSPLRNKARVAIDSLFEPLGMLVSALLFLFLQIESKTIGIVLSIFILFFVWIIRGQYPKAVLLHLLQNALHFERKVRVWIFKMARRERHAAKLHLLTLLKEQDEEMALLAIKMLLEFKDAKLLPRILTRSELFSMKSRARLVQLLDSSSFSDEMIVLEALNHWMKKLSSSALKSAILFYLAKRSLLNPERMRAELKSTDLVAKGAAILTLHLAGVETLLESKNPEELRMGLCILGAAGRPQYLQKLLFFLSHFDENVQLEAAKSIAELSSPKERWIAFELMKVVKRSISSDVRLYLLTALGKLESTAFISAIIEESVHFRAQERRAIENILVKMGLKAVPGLLKIAKNRTYPEKARLLACRLVGRIALPQLRSNLFPFLEEEMNQAFFYYFHSFQNYPVKDLSLLQEALFRCFESRFDFLIQLLSIAGQLENSELLSHSLHSHNPKVRGAAIETVERTCDAKIFQLIKPLLDERPIEEKLKIYIKRNLKVATLEELLDILEQGASSAAKLVALTIKAQRRTPAWKESLRRHIMSGDEIFYHFAYELLENNAH